MKRRAAREYLEGLEFKRQVNELKIKSIGKKFERSDNTIRRLLAGEDIEDIDPIERNLIEDCYAELQRCKAEWRKRTTTALAKKYKVFPGSIKRWAEEIQQEQKPSRGSF